MPRTTVCPNPRGFPTPSYRRRSTTDLCALRMSLLLQASASSPVIVPFPFRGVVFSACQPLDTSSSNVRFHQSTCAWYDVGLECFCRDTSEYKDCRRDLDVVVYVEHEESDTGAEAMDGQKTGQIWPQIMDHSKSHVPLLLHLLHLFFTEVTCRRRQADACG